MRNMKKLGQALVAAVAIMGSSMVASAQTAKAPPAQQMSSSKTTTATATITAIDKKNKTVTLKDEQGNTFDVQARNAKNLGKLKVGDKVDAVYYRELAIDIHSPGQKMAAPSERHKVAGRGNEPGGMAVREIKTSAKVRAVDAQGHTITVQDPKGNNHMIEVDDPSLQKQLSQLKPGDTVDVTYTQAVLISVRKAG
jgi:Cu/Ag efflux protein CusF